jgi:hypothetical protein
LDNRLGVKQTLGLGGEKYSAFFDVNSHYLYSAVPYINIRVMYNDTNVADFKQPAYTISLWFYENVAGSASGSIFNLTDTTEVDTNSGPGDSYIDIRTTSDQIRFVCVIKGILILDCKKTVTSANWHHIAVAMDVTGNRVYVDGVVLAGADYTTGTAATYINLSNAGVTSQANGLNINCISMGGVKAPESYDTYVAGDIFSCPYNGYVIVYNRALHVNEIARLYADDIGYSVLILAGQSNMPGRDTTEVGIDDDYAVHDNIVVQYKTYPNIDQTSYAVLTSTIDFASNPIAHPENSPGDKLLNNGSWRTFCNNFIQYGNMPYRMKLLIVPVAKGRSSLSTDWLPTQKYHNICVAAFNDV